MLVGAFFLTKRKDRRRHDAAGDKRFYQSLAASAAAHILFLTIPSSGEGLADLPRTYVLQPTLPAVDVRFRRNQRLHVEMSSPMQSTSPTIEVPPPQELSSDQLAHINEGAKNEQLTLPIGSLYFNPSDVSERPYPLTIGPIDVTDNTIGPNGITFSIVVFLNENGEVDGVELAKGTVPPSLWGKVVTVFGGTQYRPGKILETPVKTKLQIELWIPPLTEIQNR